MYSVLIVDDEPDIRLGMRLKIDWERLGLTFAGEAANGNEAFQLLTDTPVDIVITDMNMPLMDGVTFLESCRERYPGLRTIVITGYEDFKYAHAAVRHQARDYLLKPVARDELEAALRKIAAELDNERRQTEQRASMEWRLSQYYKEMKEHVVVQLVKAEREQPQAMRERARLFELEAWDGLTVRIVTAGLRERLTGSGHGERTPDKLRLPYELVGREFAEQQEPAPLLFKDPNYPGLLHFIIAGSAEACADFASGLSECVARLLAVEPAVGIGQPVTGFAHWRAGYMSALLAWNLTDTQAERQPEAKAEADGALREETYQLPRKLLLRGDIGAFRAMARKELEKAHRVSQAHFVKAIFQLYLGIEAAAHETGVKLNSDEVLWMRPELAVGFRTVEQAEQFLIGMAERIRRDAREESGFDAVKQFIDNHYMYELNLTMLAEKFNYHPTYFSELFKAKMGVTFVQYVSDARMAQAVRLLEDTALSLWDIAELTGFANASYFSSKFKKQYGLSPSEYRQKAAQSKHEKIDSELPKK